MIQDASGVQPTDDRIGRWLLAASVAALLIGIVSATGNRIPWPVGYGLVTAIVLLLALTAPRPVKALAFSLALIVVTGLWVGAFIEVALGYFGIFKEQPFIRANAATLAAILGALIGWLLVGSVVMGGLLFASQFVLAFQGIFGLTRRDALRALATVGFGLQYPYLIVENGQVTITKPKGLLNNIGGPGLVIVRPGNAVVFERLGRVTQIAGPGSTTTRLFEFPKQIVQLRPRWMSFSGETALTQDGIPVILQGGLGARIEPASVTNDLIAAAGGPGSYTWASGFRDQIRGEFPVYRDSVFKAVYLPSGPNWELTLNGATVAMIRDAIGRRRLQDIFGEPDTGIPPNAARVIQEIEQEAVAALRAFVHSWGVQVTGVEIALLEPPEELRQRVLKRWTIASDSQTIESIGNAEAQAVNAVQTIKTTAFQGMVNALQGALTTASATLDDQQMLRFQRVIQTIAANMTQDSSSALRYIEALEKLSGQPGARIIIGPPGQTVNVEQHD